MNETLHEHEDNVLAWIVVPAILGTLLYMTTALAVWPYARPVVTPWVIVLCIIFPPLFPFLLIVLLYTLCLFPPVVSRPEIVVVQTRGYPRAVVRERSVMGGSGV